MPYAPSPFGTFCCRFGEGALPQRSEIERNRTAAKQAKKFHGTICQACDLNFVTHYGVIGEGYIEAHHLKAISTLDEGVAVQYDIAEDFAVLCSNCHRMIHRSADPSDLVAFRALVQFNQVR